MCLVVAAHIQTGLRGRDGVLEEVLLVTFDTVGGLDESELLAAGCDLVPFQRDATWALPLGDVHTGRPHVEAGARRVRRCILGGLRLSARLRVSG